jgi:hypothetical protein
MRNGTSFFHRVMKRMLTVFKATIYGINQAIKAKDQKERPFKEIVPEQYHEFLPQFRKQLVDRSPPHRAGSDHQVGQKDADIPTWGPLYSMSCAELVLLTQWLEENMSKGFI